MNLPNKLTILRIIMAPIFLFCLICDFSYHTVLALFVFIAAALTDYADGKIARNRNLITDFGKFLDPLADKMLTTAAFIGFIGLDIGMGIVWITMIMLTREFLITSLRLAAAGGGTVIAANIWGKIKTVCQMVAIIITIIWLIIADINNAPILLIDIFRWMAFGSLWISAIMTLVSGVIYMRDNAGFVDSNK